MKVRKVTLKNYAGVTHGVSEVEFPDHGLVIIQGANGNGKSSVIDAVAESCTDKPARKLSGWLTGKAGYVHTLLDSGLVVEASCTRSGARKLKLSGPGATNGTTKTKTREILEQFVPTHPLWMSSCYLSSKSVSQFSNANDRARLEVFTELLRLSFFKRAAKAYKAEYDDAKKARDDAETVVREAKARLEALKQTRDTLGTETPEIQDVDAIRAKCREHDAEVKRLDDEIQEVQTRIETHQSDVAAARERIRVAEKRRAAAEEAVSQVVMEQRGLEQRRQNAIETREQKVRSIEDAIQAARTAAKRMAEMKAQARVREAEAAHDRVARARNEALAEAKRNIQAACDAVQDAKAKIEHFENKGVCPTCGQEARVPEGLVDELQGLETQLRSATDAEEKVTREWKPKLDKACDAVGAALDATVEEVDTDKDPEVIAAKERLKAAQDDLYSVDKRSNEALGKAKLAVRQAEEDAKKVEAADPVDLESVDSADKTIQDLLASVRTLTESKGQSQADLAAEMARGKAAVQANSAAEASAAKVQKIESEIRASAGNFALKSGELASADEAFQVATLVRSGLSPQGIPHELISQAISSIEDEANTYLSLLFPDKQVVLQLIPTPDKLNLNILGIGDDKGYDACSAGQQRRIDVALLFAFGAAARTAQGIESTTIFIDEPLDSLDADGVTGTCALITELSKTHCIVLITHQRDVAGSLRPEVVYQVESGGNYIRAA